MKLGILGLPGAGKSTLFNALTKSRVQTSGNPFNAMEPNIGIVFVPDDRLEKLSRMYNPKKTVHTTIEFIDIAGLGNGSVRGQGLGNRFLSYIREADAIIHTIKCFENENSIYSGSGIDPLGDIEIINLELIIADIETVEKRIKSAEKQSRTGDARVKAELSTLIRIKENLEKDIPVRNISLSREEDKLIKSLSLFTSKPVIYVANISEKDIGRESELEFIKKITDFAEKENSGMVILCAKIEEEIAQLADEEKKIFQHELKIEKSGLESLIESSYELLGLISFLTVGPDEVRAWTVKKGDKAPKAASKIHSDFERGFIRAEVVPSAVLIELGSYIKAKEKGLVRLEGKDYTVNDGDVIEFRFNV